MARKGKVISLMFHGVVDRLPAYSVYGGTSSSFVRTVDFESIIKYCKKNYKIIRQEDLDNYIEGGEADDAVFITFDDGLQSVCKYAVPILEKYDVPATVFLTSGWIDNNSTPTIFELEHLLFENPVKIEIAKGAFYFSKELKSRNQLAEFFDELWTVLFESRVAPLLLTDDNVYIGGKLLSSYREGSYNKLWHPSTWEDLSKANRAGVLEFGAHGVTHTPWSWLSKDELRDELQVNIGRIRQATNADVTICSFPHGQYNDDTLAVTEALFKYTYANNILGHYDKHLQPRYHVPYQRPNSIKSIVQYPFIGKVLRNLGHKLKI